MIDFLSNIRKWIITLKHHKQNGCYKTDFCTRVPDVILGFKLFLACKIHDYHYRGYTEVNSRRIADYKFFRGLISVVFGKVKNILNNIKNFSTGFVCVDFLIISFSIPIILVYLFIGLFISMVYYSTVRIVSFPFWDGEKDMEDE